MRFALRSTKLLLMCGALVVAPGVLAAPAFGSGSPVPHCPTSHLRLKFVQLQGATGHRYIDYAFKNVGAMQCSLRGYPRVVLVNRHGRAIRAQRAKVGRWPLSPARTVVIDPGKRAFFTVMWVDGGFCPGNTFAFYGLRVFPPRNLAGFRRHFGRTLTCDGSAIVSAVRPKLFPF